MIHRIPASYPHVFFPFCVGAHLEILFFFGSSAQALDRCTRSFDSSASWMPWINRMIPKHLHSDKYHEPMTEDGSFIHLYPSDGG